MVENEEKKEAAVEAATEKKEQKGPKLDAKTIEKMTIIKLKEAILACPEHPTGVHGMNKTELIDVLKIINDIPVEKKKKTDKSGDVRKIKKEIKKLREERIKLLSDSKKAEAIILRKKAKRLKRKTRKAAKSSK